MNDNKSLSVLRRLAKRNSRLVALNRDADEGPASRYGVSVTGQTPAPKPKVSAVLVRQWLSEGLVEPDGDDDGYRLSAAGRSWLRRRLSTTDDFQIQHQDRKVRVVEFEGQKQAAIVNDSESPLRWLASRKDKNGERLLAPYELEAGERLRADYQFAGLSARVTASWNPASQGNASGGGSNDAAAMQDNVMAARQRVARAIAAVGPELSGILLDVCCHLRGLEEAERMEGWPQRSGKVVLQMALKRLACHYGLISNDEANRNVRRRLSHWGAEDYRPAIKGGGSGS